MLTGRAGARPASAAGPRGRRCRAGSRRWARSPPPAARGRSGSRSPPWAAGSAGRAASLPLPRRDWSARSSVWADRSSRGRRRLPGVVGVVDLLPPPRHGPAVDRLPRGRRVVVLNADGDRRVARVVQHLPLRAGVDHGLPAAVALQQEGRPAAELRDRTLLAPVPDERREHVAAGAEVRGEVHRLVAPVHQVRALRPRRHLPSVHEEAVAVVGRHVDDETVGRRRELERAAEVEDAERVSGHLRGRDPQRRRRVLEHANLGALGFARPRKGRQDTEGHGQDDRCGTPSLLVVRHCVPPSSSSHRLSPHLVGEPGPEMSVWNS